MLPQVNAELLSITTGGIEADWAQAATGPVTTKWSGKGDAYVQEKMRTSLPGGPGGILRVKDTSIVISSDLTDMNGNPISIEGGDVFTFIWQGTTHHRVVSDEVSADLPELAVQEYVRVHFNNEAPEIQLEAN